MGINEIISNRYQDLSKLLKNTDTIVFNGMTYDDIFHAVLITQIKKYDGKQLDPDAGYELVKHAVLTEFLFLPKKKGKQIVLLAGDCLMSAKDQPFYSNED